MAMNDAMYLGGMGGYRQMSSGYSSPSSTMMSGDYDTPGYSPGYRPAYGDNTFDPYNPWTQGTSWGKSAWNMAGVLPAPFGAGSDLNAYQNANMATQYNGQNVATTPGDAAVSGAQQWILPFAAYYAGHKISRMPGGFANGGLQSAMNIFTSNQAVRLNLGVRAGQALGRGMLAPIGALGGGALRGLTGFGGFGWGMRGAGAVGSVIGAGIGYMAAPLAIGMGISHAVDSAVFNPYVDTRRMSMAMQSMNSSRIITGPNAAHGMGLGMSGAGAARTASAVSSSAWDDMTFSNAQYTSMVDYGMQAGLYDDIGGMGKGKVVERTKKMAADVKRIMAVFGEKDMREAVGILSDFVKKGGGAGSMETSNALNSLRMGTFMSGKSGRELYQSIGSPGGNIYAGYGMSQVAGMTNAMGAFSGMTNAHNMGLLSSRMLSLMGGVEGASLSATQARAGSLATDYNKMSLYAQFFGGGTSGSMMGNGNSYAMATSRDPMSAMGRMILRSPEMMDAQAKGNPLSGYSQYVQQLRQMYPGQKSFSMEQLASVMAGNGMGEDQIRAAALDITNAKRGFSGDVQGRAFLDAQRQATEQDGFSYMGPAGRSARRGLNSIGKSLSPIGEGVAVATSRAGDFLDRHWQNFRFGRVKTDPNANFFYSGGSYSQVNIRGTSSVPAADRAINAALTGRGGAEARKLAEEVISGRSSPGKVAQIAGMMGEDVSEAQAQDYHIELSGKKSVTKVTEKGPDFASMTRSNTFIKHLSMGRDGDWYSDSSKVGIDGRPTFESEGLSYIPSRTEGDIKDLAKKSPGAFEALQVVQGAILMEKSPADIAKYLSSVDKKSRFTLAGVLSPGISREADEFRDSLRSGNVSAQGLEKIIADLVDSGGLDMLLHNPASRNVVLSKVGLGKDGGIRQATSEEMKRNYARYAPLPATVGSSGRSGVHALASAAQSADINQKNNIFDMINNYEASLDGSGGSDPGSRVMLKAAGLFQTAVNQFTENVIYSSGKEGKEAGQALRLQQKYTNDSVAEALQQ
jgi:hypothetical protein